MKMDHAEKLVTIAEAAVILGAPVSQIHRMIEEGTIRTTVRDQTVFLRSDDLQRLLHDHAETRSPLFHKALRWLVVGATGAVIVGSLLPIESLGEYDSVLHWLAYLAVSTLVTLSAGRLRSMLVGILLVFGLGAVLEGLQHFIPGRNAQLDDLAANYLGVISGVILGSWLKQRWGLSRRIRE